MNGSQFDYLIDYLIDYPINDLKKTLCTGCERPIIDDKGKGVEILYFCRCDATYCAGCAKKYNLYDGKYLTNGYFWTMCKDCIV